MKPRILVGAALLPLAAVVIVLVVGANRNTTTGNLAEDAAGGNESPSLRDEALNFFPRADFDTEWPDPPEMDEQAINETLVRIRSEMLRSLNDEFRAAIDSDFARLLVAREEVDERRQAEFDRYRRDPDWPTLPALPGVSGFEIQVCPGDSICLSEVLAEQSDDPDWARPMEARIFGVLGQAASGGLTQAHVVCRETVCGILLPSLSTAARLNVVRIGTQLSEALGFAQYSYADRGEFQAIYLSNERIPGLLWMQ